MINGRAESAGTAVTSDRNGQSVTTVTLDPVKLGQWLSAGEDGAIISIPVSGGADIAVGQLNGQLIKGMAGKKAVLELKTDIASYIVPAEQIDIDATAAQLGVSSADLQEITIQVEIAAPTASQLQAAQKAAEQGDFTIVIPPVSFTVRAVFGDKSIPIERFGGFVERLIAMPDNIDPSLVTTAVVIEEDGTVRHVPTKIVVVDGKRYAQVNSLTNSTYALVQHSITFADVEGHWAKDAVNELGSRMVVSGSGNGLYLPSADMTRAEFAAIVVRGLGLKPAEGTSEFTDVQASDWYSGVVTTAHAYGLIGGFEDGTFRPKDKITREQAMVILAKAMALTGLKTKLALQSEEATLLPYEDSAAISTWAKEAVASSIEAGIVTGRSATALAPKAYITRAEVAIIVQRLLQKSDLT